AFNLLGRVVGVGFVLIGSLFFLLGAVHGDWIMGSAGFLVAGLGVLLVLAKPYRPKSKPD
ncbi:MAG: hypothetical protein QOD03_1432, partial [Verrucomicrobiota bacterium]